MKDKFADPPSGAHAFLQIDRLLPLIVERTSATQDLVEWGRVHSDWIREELELHGAVMFRGFHLSVDKLPQFVEATGGQACEFTEESSPRREVAKDVFTSTDYPAQYPIQLHNEFAYSSRWPMRIYFYCVQPPNKGGATPVADCRRVLAELSPDTRHRFESAGVLYRRNYYENFGVSWQVAFGTPDRRVVEDYARSTGMSVSWDPDGSLRTQFVRDAIVRHPSTGEPTWFNHAFFFNRHAIEPVEIREILLEQTEYSTDTFFGDGSPIEPRVIEEIRAAYAKCSSRVPWFKGDVLLVDNMLAAHGRESFAGTRKVVVSMSQPYRVGELPSRNPASTHAEVYDRQIDGLRG